MQKQSVVFFDGLCNLCNDAVQFMIVHDKKNALKFASLQSEYARNALKPFNIDATQSNSFVLLEGGKVYQRSTAALKVAKKLDKLWPLLYGLMVVPRFIRDGVYNYVGNNRYKWFGKKESCWIPTQALKEKFLS